jgi:hypothetical protein
MGIPFRKSLVFTLPDDAELTPAQEAKSLKVSEKVSLTLRPPTVTTTAELTPEQLFTLRTCKSCRGDFLQAIQNWFSSPRTHPDGDADTPDESSPPGRGSGIFVRENGINVEITREEWDRRVNQKLKETDE